MVQKPQSLFIFFHPTIVTNGRDIGFFEVLLASLYCFSYHRSFMLYSSIFKSKRRADCGNICLVSINGNRFAASRARVSRTALHSFCCDASGSHVPIVVLRALHICTPKSRSYAFFNLKTKATGSLRARNDELFVRQTRRSAFGQATLYLRTSVAC